MTLTIERLHCARGTVPVLRDITLPAMEAGTVTAIVGPNGAGKSTLLRCLAGLERFSGSVTGTGAGDVLYLPQDPPPVSSLTVFEVVLVAKQQGVRGFAGLRVDAMTRRLVGEVLARLDLQDLSGRTMAELSGGQRQLVSFAQAVVREPAVLLLDEPTSALDLRNQLVLLRHIRDFASFHRAAVVVAVHDLTQAARFADRVVVLHDGAVHSCGAGHEVITEAMLREVYRVTARVHHTDDGIAVATTEALSRERRRPLESSSPGRTR